MTNDNDLIRRGAVLAELPKHANGTTMLGGQSYRSMTLEVALEAIRAIPAVAASQPAVPDWTASATDMLCVWDKWLSGTAGGDDAAAHKLSLASAFAAQAFETLASSNITADGAPTALLRAFLMTLIDPLHPDLDYLRQDPNAGETARSERAALKSIAAAKGGDA